jgi:nucleotide-binding universal stress UspA family protein
MFRRILVPIDSTARGTESAEVGRRLAERTGARLLLLHVAGPDISAADSAHAESAMDKIARAANGRSVESRVEWGEPVRVIGEVANQEAVDVIVLAPHHRGWFEVLARPSVTGQLVSRARAPLLIWPEAGRGNAFAHFLGIPNSHVIVALDGSDLAEAALPHAVKFAREYTRPLLLVRVVPPDVLVGSTPEAAWFETEREEARDGMARTYLRNLRHRLAGEIDVPITTMVPHGPPARELTRIATNHDGSLLVMGTHGRGGFTRLLMGSVTAQVVKDTPIPVLVVRPAGAEESARFAPRAAKPTERLAPTPENGAHHAM